MQIGSNAGAYESLYQRLTFSHLEPPHGYLRMPHDVYCPSTADTLIKRVCDWCGKSGKRAHSCSAPVAANTADNDDDADTDATTHQSTAAAGTDAPGTDEHMPVVRNLFDWLKSAIVDSE